MRTITLIPGDGIGPEITDAAIRIINAAGPKIDWEIREAGAAALEKYGNPLPEETLASIGRNRVALKGPTATPAESGYRSVNVALRKYFDLYVGFRPVKSLPRIKTRYAEEKIDIIVFRENTEEFYIGEERYTDDTHMVAEAVGRVTRVGSERFFRYAFEYARMHERKKVTIVHKANILKFIHGLFLETGREVAKDFPEIQCNDLIVDNMNMQLIMNPLQFDVIATTNLLGDIVSDACAALVGGLGFAPGANIGKDIAIFEAVHGTAPDIAGKGIANPTAIVLSSVMMLEYIGETSAAEKIRRAVIEVISEGRKVTKDINKESSVGTAEFADATIEKIQSYS